MSHSDNTEKESMLRQAKYTHVNAHDIHEDAEEQHMSPLSSPAPPSYTLTEQSQTHILPTDEYTPVTRSISLKTLVFAIIVSFVCGVITTVSVGALIMDMEHHSHHGSAEGNGAIAPYNYVQGSYQSAAEFNPDNKHHKHEIKKAVKKAMKKYHQQMHDDEHESESDTEHTTEVGKGGYPYHVAKQSKVDRVDKCEHIYKPGVMEAGSVLSVKTSMDVNSAMEYVRHFNMAKKEIVIVVYKFTDIAAMDALKNAIKRGVEVFILADFVENHKKKKVVNKLARHGAHVRLFNGFAGMHKLHAKFVVVDKMVALTGSANLSHNSAASNMELILALESKNGVKALRCKFWELWNYGVANPATKFLPPNMRREEPLLLE